MQLPRGSHFETVQLFIQMQEYWHWETVRGQG